MRGIRNVETFGARDVYQRVLIYIPEHSETFKQEIRIFVSCNLSGVPTDPGK